MKTQINQPETVSHTIERKIHATKQASVKKVLQKYKSSTQQQRIIQMATLFRGMQADVPGGNSPILGNTNGFQLGVRNSEGTDNPLGFVNPQSGGMSTASPRINIPPFTISSHYQNPHGAHQTADSNSQYFRWIWSINDVQLPATLVARNDHGQHYSIEPAIGQQLTRAQFQNAVQGTQNLWQRIDD